MKNKFLSRLRKIQILAWSCLWSIAMMFWLPSRPAIAQSINFGPDLDCPAAENLPNPYPLNVAENGSINESIDVVNSPDIVDWSFDTAPISFTGSPPCTGGGDAYTCNNVDITIPSEEVSGESASVYSTDATPKGNYFFTLRVEDASDDNVFCARDYTLNIESPFDLSFVLDRSYSMTEPANPSDPSGLSRWEALRTAVRESTTLASFINDVIELPAPDNSRLGLTIFGEGIADESFAVPQPIDDNLETLVEDAIANPPSYPTGNATHMGPGIEDAEAKLNDCDRKRLIVLFTDGQQFPSTASFQVAANGTNYINDDPINATCTGGDENPIEIVPVGIMQPSSDYATLLQTIAVENGENSAIFTTTGLDFSFQDGSAVTFDTALTQAIVQALSGSSPQIIAQDQNRLTGDIALPPFSVNRHVRQLILKLTVGQELNRSTLEDLLANVQVLKDNNDVTSYFQPTIAGDASKTIWLRSRFQTTANSSQPPLSPEGTYQVQLRQPSSIVEPIPVQLVSIADDRALDMAWSVKPDAPRTNRAFSPTVELKWQGEPIPNAKVEASILRPGDDLGDLLARTRTPIRIANQGNLAVSEATAPALALRPQEISVGARKYVDLLRYDRNFIRRLKPKEQTLSLNYQGDGIYSAAYNPGDISGVYQVLYRVTAADPSFGKIERKAVQSVYVNPAPISLKRSTIKTLINPDGTITTVLRPVTEDGKLIGPGQLSSFNVKGLASAQILEGAKQDGTYEIKMKPKRGVDPRRTQISLSFRGQETYRGLATQLKARPGLLTRVRDRIRLDDRIGNLRRIR